MQACYFASEIGEPTDPLKCSLLKLSSAIQNYKIVMVAHSTNGNKETKKPFALITGQCWWSIHELYAVCVSREHHITKNANECNNRNNFDFSQLATFGFSLKMNISTIIILAATLHQRNSTPSYFILWKYLILDFCIHKIKSWNNLEDLAWTFYVL